MRKVLGTLALSLLLLSCQNKSKQEYSPTLKELVPDIKLCLMSKLFL